jgi:CheY-like chemotaxis protein
MTALNPILLYVEDEARSRRVMQMTINSLEIDHLTIFEDSRDFEARVQALSPKPEVIFLDIHMLPIDGFEMLKRLRAMPEYQKTPIVAMTASVMSEEIHQLRTAGFDGCIAKPIDIDTFPDSLRRICMGEQVWRIV